MRPRRTVESNKVFTLPGGNEDNDLWVFMGVDQADRQIIASTWVPDEDERAAIADGANLELIVWGEGTPPVAVRTTSIELGKAKVE